MSAFLKKNPRLATLIKSDEALAPSVNKASSLLPGVIASTVGAAASLCSSGIASLDAVLGGGIPVGSAVLVHEDIPASKANFCWSGPVRCFLAECIAAAEADWTRKDGGWMAVVGHDISGILNSLPKATAETTSKPSTASVQSTAESMKIAWRYEGMKEFDSSLKKADTALAITQQIGHSFDLGRRFDELPKQMEERSFVMDLSDTECACTYKTAWSFIEGLVKGNQRFGLGRLVIGGLGSPGIWKCDCDSGCGPVWFTRMLSNLLQETESSHPCVCLLTIQSVFLNSSQFLTRQKLSSAGLPAWVAAVETLSDAVLELKPIDSLTFKSDSKSPLAREYDGFLIVRKPLRRPNSFRPSVPETQNLVFKIKRRRFVIEKFHLPPALNDAPEPTMCSSGIGSGQPHPLDF